MSEHAFIYGRGCSCLDENGRRVVLGGLPKLEHRNHIIDVIRRYWTAPIFTRTLSGFSGSRAGFAAAPTRAVSRSATTVCAAAAAPVQANIRIKLKSYKVAPLIESCEKIMEAAAESQATAVGP
eukprot:6694388-Pyramimonas_sp.AAC.1